MLLNVGQWLYHSVLPRAVFVFGGHLLVGGSTFVRRKIGQYCFLN